MEVWHYVVSNLREIPTKGTVMINQIKNSENWKLILTLPAPCISESCTEIKIKLNFYFHTSLWCLKRFYEGLKALGREGLN